MGKTSKFHSGGYAAVDKQNNKGSNSRFTNLANQDSPIAMQKLSIDIYLVDEVESFNIPPVDDIQGNLQLPNKALERIPAPMTVRNSKKHL